MSTLMMGQITLLLLLGRKVVYVFSRGSHNSAAQRLAWSIYLDVDVKAPANAAIAAECNYEDKRRRRPRKSRRFS